MVARALRFGVRAEAYERFRPAHPEELFDLALPGTVEITADIIAHLARRRDEP